MSTRPATASEPHLPEPERATSRKLAGWLVFVGLFIAVNYTLNYATTTSKSEEQTALYKYSTAAGTVFLYAVMLAIVLLIAGHRRDLLALRRPPSWLRALGVMVIALLASYVVVAILDSFLHGGREQGLVPKYWMHRYLGAYVANWVAIAVVDPIVEELTFRGLGFSLLARRYGPRVAILSVGLLFAAAHGFLQAFPELAVLGCVLAWLRARFDSVYPGMLLHGLFNSIALAIVFFNPG